MYTQHNPNSPHGTILLVEHAGALIPPAFQNLGLDGDLFQQDPQMFYDPYAADMATAIANALNLTVILGTHSRLLVDLNREDYHTGVIPTHFHGRAIPANNNMTEAQRLARLQTYYYPFHHAVRQAIFQRQQAGQTVRLISIHSFNVDTALASFPHLPALPVDLAMLFTAESPLVTQFRASIKPAPFMLRENYPYDLRALKTGSILENQKLFGVDVLGLEINAQTAAAHTQHITTILTEAIKNL